MYSQACRGNSWANGHCKCQHASKRFRTSHHLAQSSSMTDGTFDSGYEPSNKLFDTDNEDSGPVCGPVHENSTADRFTGVAERCKRFENRFRPMFKKDLPLPISMRNHASIEKCCLRKRRCHPLPPLEANVYTRPPLSRVRSSDDLLSMKKSLQPARRINVRQPKSPLSNQEIQDSFSQTAPAVLERYYGENRCKRAVCKSLEALDSFPCIMGKHRPIHSNYLDTSDFDSSISSTSFAEMSFSAPNFINESKASHSSGHCSDCEETKFNSDVARQFEKVSTSFKCRKDRNTDCYKSSNSLGRKKSWRMVENRDQNNNIYNSYESHDFMKSKSDTALNKLLSQIPSENLSHLKYEKNQNNVTCIDFMLDEKKKFLSKWTSDTNIKRNLVKLSSHSNHEAPKYTRTCSKRLTVDDKMKSCAHTSGSLGRETISRCNTNIDTSSFSRSEGNFNSPISSAKVKVQDLIQKFSSMENLCMKKTQLLPIQGSRRKVQSFRKSTVGMKRQSSVCGVNTYGRGVENLDRPSATKSYSQANRRRFSTISSIDEDYSSITANESAPSSDAENVDCDSPFTRIFKRAPVLEPSRLQSTRPNTPVKNHCRSSPKAKSPNSDTVRAVQACNKCGSKEVKEYPVYSRDTEKSLANREKCKLPGNASCNAASYIGSTGKLNEKQKPYIQLKSFRSWLDVNNNVESKKIDLISQFSKTNREEIENLKVGKRDKKLVIKPPFSAPLEEHFSKIGDSSNISRRLSIQSTGSNSSECWKFDPICSSRISDFEDFHSVNEIDSITHFSNSQENNLIPSDTSSENEKDENNLPFYSRLFRSSKRYFKRVPHSLQQKSANDLASSTNFLNCLQQRRHSLSSMSRGTKANEKLISEPKRLTPSSLYPLSMSSASLIKPPYTERPNHESHYFEPALSPPYFSASDSFTCRRKDFGFKSMRITKKFM